MENKIDPVDISDEDITEGDFSEAELADETTDWRAKAEELKGLNKRRATKLRKAKESLAKITELEVELQTLRQKPPEDKQTSGPDYGQLAYLAAKGIEHEEDISYVTQIAGETKESLDKVLTKPYVQAELKLRAETRKTAEATPGSPVRSADARRDKVEYWLNKPFAEIPPEMRREVVKARIAAEKSGTKKFSDQPVVM